MYIYGIKRIKVHTTKTVNNFFEANSGELLDTSIDVKHTKIAVLEKGDFVLMYAAVVGLVEGMEKAEITVLFWCVMNCQINTNEVSLVWFMAR